MITHRDPAARWPPIGGFISERILTGAGRSRWSRAFKIRSSGMLAAEGEIRSFSKKVFIKNGSEGNAQILKLKETLKQKVKNG